MARKSWKKYRKNAPKRLRKSLSPSVAAWAYLTGTSLRVFLYAAQHVHNKTSFLHCDHLQGGRAKHRSLGWQVQSCKERNSGEYFRRHGRKNAVDFWRCFRRFSYLKFVCSKPFKSVKQILRFDQGAGRTTAWTMAQKVLNGDKLRLIGD